VFCAVKYVVFASKCTRIHLEGRWEELTVTSHDAICIPFLVVLGLQSTIKKICSSSSVILQCKLVS